MCRGKVGFRGGYKVICRNKEGKILWVEEIDNLIVNSWLNSILDILYNLDAQPTNLYMGLVDGSVSPVFDPTDTAASHPGWSEIVDYSEATRPAWNPGAAASQEVENAAAIVFSMNPGAPIVVAGLFIIDGNAVKGDFATGRLVSEVGFAQGAKNISDGDTLEITYKQGAASVTP